MTVQKGFAQSFSFGLCPAPEGHRTLAGGKRSAATGYHSKFARAPAGRWKQFETNPACQRLELNNRSVLILGPVGLATSVRGGSLC